MAGIISQAMGMPEQGMQNQSMQNEQPNEQSASPEDQDQYDRVVMAAMKIIYDEKANQDILKMLASGKDNPAEVLTQTALLIMKQIGGKAGGVRGDIATEASEEVLSMLAELADKAGIFTVDDQVIEQTSQQMAQTLVGEGGQKNAQQVS